MPGWRLGHGNGSGAVAGQQSRSDHPDPEMPQQSRANGRHVGENAASTGVQHLHGRHHKPANVEWRSQTSKLSQRGRASGSGAASIGKTRGRSHAAGTSSRQAGGLLGGQVLPKEAHATSMPLAVGFLTPHGATAPESAIVLPEVEECGPSLLRVAGFRTEDAEQRWDDVWCDHYDSIPARCDEHTPLGMAPDCELFEAVHVQASFQEVAPQKSGHAVLIQGIPRELCTEPLFQVVLQQAGLKGHITDCVFQEGHCGGEALVWVSDRSLAEYVVWHFNGCHWNDGFLLACLVDTAPMPEASSEVSDALAEQVLGALLMPPEEWPKDTDGNDIQVPTWRSPMVIDCHPDCSNVCLMAAVEVPTWLAPMPTDQSDFCVSQLGDSDCTPLETAGMASVPAVAIQKPLSTIWEECGDLIAAEVSTDAGASNTSVASEAEDSHEGEEGVGEEAVDNLIVSGSPMEHDHD